VDTISPIIVVPRGLADRAGPVQTPTVAGDDVEIVALQAQRVEAGGAGVEQSPAHEGARPTGESRLAPAVHQDDLTLAPGHPGHGVGRGGIGAEQGIGQHQDRVLGGHAPQRGVDGVLHDDGADQAGGDLGGHPSVDEGVVPEQAAAMVGGDLVAVGALRPRGHRHERVVARPGG
jgi:hypothetical protein